MLCKQGRLSESLLPYLWRGTALQQQDYPAAVRMLCDAGVLIDLLPGEAMGGAGGAPEAGGEAQQWVMPMRLSSERPANVDAKLWPPTKLEAAKVQLGARFDFMGCGVPAGFFERCAAAVAARGTLLVIWNGGLVLSTAGSAARVLLQLTQSDAGTVLEVELRAQGGSAPWPVLARLVDSVRTVLDEFPGLQVDEQLLCPRCRAEGRWAAPGSWPLPEASRLQLEPMFCGTCSDTIELAPTGAGGVAAAVGTPVAVPAAIAVGTAVQQGEAPKPAVAFKPSAINQPGEWDFFLSHTQRDGMAVALAEVLCSQFEKMGVPHPISTTSL